MQIGGGTSHVAGIVDAAGGLRVVVTRRRRDFARHHVRRGERLFVHPTLKVTEPVPWEQVPELIDTVYRYVNAELAPTNDCGDCMACCRTLYIKHREFKKNSHHDCP